MKLPSLLRSVMLAVTWLASGCHLIFPFNSARPDAAAVRLDSGPEGGLGQDALALDLGDAGQLTVSDTIRVWQTVHAPDAGTTGPGRLYSPVAIYHEKRQSVVIYGGTDQYGDEQAAMWEYNSTGWTKLCDACLPGPRTGHGMVYDSAKGRVLLYGGVQDSLANAQALADLWVWEYEDLTIPPTSTATTGADPGPLVEMYMVYDSARQVTVMFGGREAQSTAAAVMRNDLYELQGYVWSGPLPATSATRPTPRYSYTHSMTFVPAAAAVSPRLQNRVVLCGGAGENISPVDDCWAWDGKAWDQLCGPTSGGCTGTPQLAGALVYDLHGRRLLLMGGWNGPQLELEGTWASSDGEVWNLLDPLLPPARDTMGVAYRLVDEAILIHGGNGRSCKTIDDGILQWAGNCGETYLLVVQP